MTQKFILDAQTGKTTVTELTETEIAQREKDLANSVATQKAQADAQIAKAAARQAVLDKLGLTADEAAALLG